MVLVDENGGRAARLRVRLFDRRDYWSVAKIATTEAIGADRGGVIVAAMIETL